MPTIACAGWTLTGMISLDLAVNAVIAGLLLGGFYAAVTIGVTISFGMLDIVNIAHPAFIMLGSFVAYIVNSNFGIDPMLIGIVDGAGIFSGRDRSSTRSITMPSSSAAKNRFKVSPSSSACCLSARSA